MLGKRGVLQNREDDLNFIPSDNSSAQKKARKVLFPQASAPSRVQALVGKYLTSESSSPLSASVTTTASKSPISTIHSSSMNPQSATFVSVPPTKKPEHQRVSFRDDVRVSSSRKTVSITPFKKWDPSELQSVCDQTLMEVGATLVSLDADLASPQFTKLPMPSELACRLPTNPVELLRPSNLQDTFTYDKFFDRMKSPPSTHTNSDWWDSLQPAISPDSTTLKTKLNSLDVHFAQRMMSSWRPFDFGHIILGEIEMLEADTSLPMLLGIPRSISTMLGASETEAYARLAVEFSELQIPEVNLNGIMC
jgi:hypothetical protein